MSTPPDRKPTPGEVAALLKGWQALEKSRAKALLAAERRTSVRLRAVLKGHVSAASLHLEGLRHTPAAARVGALGAIHRTAALLQPALAAAIVSGRTDARSVSRDRTDAELEHLRTLLRRDGWEDSELPPDSTPADASADPVAAASTAASLSSRWAILAMGAVRQWELDPSTSLPAAVGATASAAAPALNRAAATEVASAFNEEHADNLEPLSDYDWAPQVFRVWSALLDGRVCQRCFENDGDAVPVNSPFRSGDEIPLHPFCRCMAVPLYIPKPKALQDVALDYAGYKAEIRDLIREKRAKPVDAEGRHAASFIQRSKGVTRSPVVISKDFTSGRLKRTGT